MLRLICVASLSITGVADGLSIFPRLKNRGIYKRHCLEKQRVLKEREMATYIKRSGRCSLVNHILTSKQVWYKSNQTEPRHSYEQERHYVVRLILGA